MVRYIIQVVDTSTLEASSDIAGGKTQFLDVVSARNHILDMIVRAKQFPCKVEFALSAKWCSNDVETYAMLNVTYSKRGERVYYQIKKVDVVDDTLDENKVVDEAYTEVQQQGSANPFDAITKKD